MCDQTDNVPELNHINLVEVFEDELFINGIPPPHLHPLGAAQQGEQVSPLLLAQTLDLTRLEGTEYSRTQRGQVDKHKL